MGALDQYVPAGLCTYSRPTGGMFLWLTFPSLAHVTTQQLFEAFAGVDVIVAPGTGFYVPGLWVVLTVAVAVRVVQRAVQWWRCPACAHAMQQ